MPQGSVQIVGNLEILTKLSVYKTFANIYCQKLDLIEVCPNPVQIKGVWHVFLLRIAPDLIFLK